MRTTDNCAMPGPGDIREREPLPNQPLTEAEAAVIRDRMIHGETMEYLNLFRQSCEPPRDPAEFCDAFDAFVVAEILRESRE